MGSTPELNDTHFMGIALEEAKKAFKEGEVPVGAVLVMGGRVVAAAHNRRESSNDPTAHAELLALKQAASEAGTWRLTGATLYVTKEPCVMCAGSMINSRLGKLVYGCSDEKGGAISIYGMLTDGKLNHVVEVLPGVLEVECARVLREFFGNRRGG